MIPSRTVSCGTATITYDLILSRRKTVGISVKPDSQVTVRAPIGAPLKEIDRLVQKRAAWILRHQHKFESYARPSPPRQYISGESHRYLGKQYRLEVTPAKNDSVKLIRGRFLVTVRDNDPDRVKHLLTGWYRRQARRIFAERLEVNYPIIRRDETPYPELKIRLMKKRWGSCSATSRINLNLRLIQAPKPYIDYVIIHELCHLIEHNHGRAFYALMDRLLPDWRQRREALNQLDIA
jgi:predicted metal-dependent hydrolase